jgi:ABC-type transport system substrate-binding protein/PKD repeat protein
MITGVLVILPGAARGADYEPNVLYVGLQQDTPDFNIYNPGTYTVIKGQILGFGYESIAAADYDMRIFPLLAQSWMFDEGTLTTTIELRQGVLFHDSTPDDLSDNVEMTADDVVFSYLIARDGTVYSSNIVNAFDMDDDGFVSETELNTCVQKTGDYTVQMTMARPYGQFFSVTLGVPIVPMHVWENYLTVDGVVDVTRNEVDMTWGTGGFYYAEGSLNSYRVIEKFDGYWGKDFLTPAGWPTYPISVEAVHFTIYAAMADAILALQSSAIDYIANSLSYDQTADLADNPDIGLEYMADSAYFYLAFNMKREPFGGLEFRRAVSHLIDKDQIVEVYMDGLGQVGSSAVPPYYGEWYNPAVTKYPFDLAAATDLLDAGGYVDGNGDGWRDMPDGSLMEKITVLSPPAEYDPIRTQACQMIASNMRSVGINTEAEATDFNILVAKMNSFDYQMLSIGWRFTGYTECVSVLFDIYGPLSASNTWAFWSETNPNPYYSEVGGVSTLADEATQAYADEFLALEDEARASFDTTEQINLVKQGQEIIADAVPCNVLYYRVNVEAHNDAWTNWTVSEGSLLNRFSLCILEYTGTRGLVDADHPVNTGLSMPGQVLLGQTAPAWVVAIDHTGAPVLGADVSVTIEGVDAGDATVSASPSTGTTDSSGSFLFDLIGDDLGSSKVTVSVTSGAQTSEDSSYIEVVPEIPRTLALKVSPEKTILAAGESVDVLLTVTDELGNPVENAEIAVDPYLVGYGSVAPVTAYTDSSGEATMTYTSPATDLINRHIVATLSLSASAEGFDWATTARTDLAVLNDAPPDWYVTSIDSVTTTALTPTDPTATITVLLTDCAGNPLEGEILDVTYSNESRVSSPVSVTGATAADGTASFDVTMTDTGVSGAVRVTIGMITVANSISDTVTLTYSDPADVLATDYYGGYVQYDLTKFVDALGSIHVTAHVFDQDGTPANGVNATVIVPAATAGQMMEWDFYEFTPLWEWVGATLQTTADEQSLAATGVCATPMTGRAVDYMNFWYGYVPMGVTLVGGVYEMDLYGADIASLDVVTDIYVMPGSWCTATFDGEEDFGTRDDFGPWPLAFYFWGPSLISSSLGYGRAYSFVTTSLDIETPIMVARNSSYDSSAVGILVTDETGSPVEGAEVLVHQVESSSGSVRTTDYIVEPNYLPYRPASVYTDVNGQAAVTIVAVPPTYVPTSVTVLPDVYAQTRLIGSLSLMVRQEVAIHPQPCFVNPVPVIDVQTAGVDIVVQVFVTDAGGNPLEGITVDLVPGAGTVVEPPLTTDSIGNATFHIDTTNLTGIAAGFIPVTVSAGGPAYAAAGARMMIPIAGTGVPGPTAIDGVVSDAVTGDPIGAAYIMLTGTPGDYYVTADDDGYYYVEVEPGWYTALVDEAGYVAFIEEVEAIDGATVSFDIELIPVGAIGTLRLFGWVTDNETGEGIQDALVSAIEMAEYTWLNQTMTDGTGYYEMYGPSALLTVIAQAAGYNMWYGEVDGTGLTELQLDMALDAAPYGPNLTLEISPYTNVSELNPLNAHFTVQDTDLVIFELAIMKLWNTTAGGSNYTYVDGYMAIAGMDPEWSDFPWSYDNGTYTGDVEWLASTARSGWLSNSTTTEHLEAYAHRDIMGDESYGLMGYYSNDTVADENGIAWFDNVTHEFEEFDFDSDLPSAFAPDPSGVLDPIQVVYAWKEGMTIWDMTATFEKLGPRSVADLTFEIDYLALSGEYSAWLLAYDMALNLNVTKEDFTVDTDPPVADAGDDHSVVVGTTMTFSGAGSSDNVGITSYEWTVTRGATTETFSGESIDYTFATSGTYTVTLTVTDGAGHSASDSATVLVTAIVDEVPIADAGEDQVVDEDTVVIFDGTGSSDDHAIDNYTWTIEELDAEMYGAEPEYTFAQPGTYHVTLVVTDDASQVSDPDEMVVTVTDVTAPTADAGGDQAVTEGDTVSFDGTGSTDDGGTANLNYTWTFEYDGETVTRYGAEPEFTFEIAGEYNVTLTVEDEDGLTDDDTMTVTVEEKNPSFIEQYWWTLALVAAIVVVALALFMLMRKKKAA